jgi:NAD(P)-dependent dehydrogenase (short-subunit alcohol dehydrogenase family)
VLEQFGGVDIIVHNIGASFSRPGGVLGLADEDWLRALSTNLLSTVRIDRLLLPSMLAQKSGVILHTSSVQWRRPDSSSPAYAAAKAALRRPAGAEFLSVMREILPRQVLRQA